MALPTQIPTDKCREIGCWVERNPSLPVSCGELPCLPHFGLRWADDGQGPILQPSGGAVSSQGLDLKAPIPCTRAASISRKARGAGEIVLGIDEQCRPLGCKLWPCNPPHLGGDYYSRTDR